MKFKLTVGLMFLITWLAGCSSSMVKPEDKKVEALITFEMPDYEASSKGVVEKSIKWLQSGEVSNDDSVQFIEQGDNEALGKGLVIVKLKGDELKVQFDLVIEAVNEKSATFKASNFVDLPGPLQGESDNAYIFYNKVKDQVIEMSDEYQDFMNEDTKAPKDNLLGI